MIQIFEGNRWWDFSEISVPFEKRYHEVLAEMAESIGKKPEYIYLIDMGDSDE